MATKVYGASDDCIEFDGEVYGEVCYYEGGDECKGVLLFFMDGTLLHVVYGKPVNRAIWAITVLCKGNLFDRIEICENEEAEKHSDVAYFKTGLNKTAFAATEWQQVE